MMICTKEEGRYLPKRAHNSDITGKWLPEETSLSISKDSTSTGFWIMSREKLINISSWSWTGEGGSWLKKEGL